MARAEVATTESAAPGQTASARDGFLDLVRAVAIVRVVLWHAYGAPFLSWLVAAMPAMFFVTGNLLAGSAERRGAWRTVLDRLRRLALPVWCFAAFAWAATALAAPDEAVRWWHPLTWLVPVVDPVGTDWEGGWLSSPLWYLRALLWLLVLSPWLLAAARRRPRAVLAVGVAAVLVTDRLAWWYAADLALYGTFLVAGAAVRTRPAPRSPRLLLAVAGVAAALAIAWRATHDVHLGVVNNSHVLHLLVGTTWLSLALAAEAPLRRLAQRPAVNAAIRGLGRRALTVYLWHGAAIAVALGLLDRAGVTGGVHRLAYPLLVVAGTAAAAAAHGWLEDRAARRAVHEAAAGRASLHRFAGVGVTLAALAVAFAPASVDGVHRPPIPSQRPPSPDETRELVLAEAVVADAPFDDARLAELLEGWAATSGTPGAVVGVALPGGDRWHAATGRWPDTGAPVAVEDRFDAMSVMKLVTATLLLQAAEAGAVALDDPIPPLPALPELVDVTPRALLTHRSGLPDVRDPSAATPIDLLRTALDGDRVDDIEYASTNYLALGLLLEHVNGRPFADQVADLATSLGLTSTTVLDTDAVGVPTTGAGGLATSVDDLLTLGDALLVDGVGLDRASRRLLRAPDRATGVGHGVMGFCPCSDEPGEPRFAFLGHPGGGTLLVVGADTDVTIALHVTDSLWEPEERFADALRLLTSISAALGPGGGRP